MNYFNMKITGIIALTVLLIVFTVLGFRAMRKDATHRDIDAFWVCNIVFLGILALYIYIYVTPFLALAPLFPLILFSRMFILSRKKDADKK